ncbi:MAG: hypothetical protein ABGY10_09115 [bacterium]
MLRNTLNTFITATLIMLLGVSSSASAQTIVPMGDLMGKTSVTVGGVEVTTYSSALKIDFVPKAPVLSSIERQTLEKDAESATATFSITSQANGNANYTLASKVNPINLVDGGLVVTFAPSKVENLGATAVVKVNEDRHLLSVPSDGAVDAEVNGIKATDKVMIDGVEYTVEAVEDDGAIATIRLADALPDGASPSMGTPIWEKQVVTATLADIGDVKEEGLPSNVTVTVTASYDGLSDDTTFIASRTVLPWARTYVRNTTDEEKNPTSEVAATLPEENAFEVDGTWYFSSLAGADPEEGLAEGYNEAAQVKAAAGDTLEYVIVASAGNTQPEQEFTIVETFPPFGDYKRGQFQSSQHRPSNTSPNGLTWAIPVPLNENRFLKYTLQLGEAEEVVSEDLGEGGVSPEGLKSDPGKPWVEGAMLEGDTPCWDDGYTNWARLDGYVKGAAEGWVAGVAAGWHLQDEETKSALVALVDKGTWRDKLMYLPNGDFFMSCKPL